MAPPKSRRRRRGDDSDESDDDDAVGNSSQLVDHSTKRQRLEIQDQKSNGLSAATARPNANIDPNDITTYHPGSIVKIRVKNFVTYTSAEFLLGPSLNMIIGPNGTGKSTLVCAICLGLGWGPKNLGRAKELGEFVKHGAQQATIEIELKGGDAHDGRNIIIKRVIKREGNKSLWFLDGESTSQAAVVTLAKSFSIQVDNLCQFLPQDRVVEFAQMHPVEMLASTQRAAASSDMIEMHEKLKELKAEEIREKVALTGNKEQLTSLQNRQTQQRADVERMEERTNLKNKIELYDKFKPLIKYKEIRIQDKEAKERMQECRAELHELERQVEPSLTSLQEWQTHSRKFIDLKEDRRARYTQLERNLGRFKDKHAQVARELENLESERKAEFEANKNRQKEMMKAKDRIRRFERDYEENRVEFDLQAFQDRVQVEREKKRRGDNQLREIDNSLLELESQSRPVRQQVETLKRDLAGLESQTGQRMEKLKRMSADTARAYAWLQQNKSRFEEEVFGPPLVVCSVKNPRYADVAEAVLQKSDFFMFTCTNNRDLKTFQKAVYGKELALVDVTVRSITRPLSDFRSPLAPEELKRQYGLDGWVIDLLDGPTPVLAALCDSSRVHRTGYTLQDTTAEQFDLLRNSETVPSWVTPKHVNSVTRRREYGPKAVSIQTRPVVRASRWTSSIDTNAQDDIKRKMAEATQQFQELQAEYRRIKETKAESQALVQEAQSEISKITEEKDRVQRVHGAWASIPAKIDTWKSKLSDLQAAGTAIVKTVTAIAVRQDEAHVKKAQLVIDYVRAVKELEKPYFELVEADVWALEAKSQEDTLKLLNLEVTNQLNNKKAEVQELELRHREIRAEGRRLAAEASAVSGTLTAEERAVHRELNEQEITLEQLETEILSMNTRLGLLHEGNPSALAQYERRKVEIEKLAKMVEGHAAKLSRLNAQMEEIREEWEPRLDELVSRISDAFSHNFDQIGCAGQVSVHKDDDFAKWEIRIYVKFREHEQLSLLDSHRQSGGERSVSTIFYLMALQSLARSPFRVVDEINQGMDPRNERTVHERMVDIACGENTSQYFLITPKLLTGLKYHPRMKVHVINSGESVPDDMHALDLSKAVRSLGQLRGVAVG